MLLSAHTVNVCTVQYPAVFLIEMKMFNDVVMWRVMLL